MLSSGRVIRIFYVRLFNAPLRAFSLIILRIVFDLVMGVLRSI